MKNVPPLPTSNRFAPLWLDVADAQSTIVTPPMPEKRTEDPVTSPLKTYPTRRRRWERKLPRTYIRSAEPGPRSLSLKVEIQSTDTGVIKGVTALLDSGATGLFIDRDFVRAQGLTTRALTHPIPVRNVDGTLNASGAIQEVVDLILRYKGHAERAVFSVSQLGVQKLILGHTWLRLHNPEIDWKTQEVQMSRCPVQCGACRAEVRREKEEQKRIHACRAGSPPAFTRTEEDAEEDATAPEEATVEEGDRICATLLFGEGDHFINATSTTSQRLAEAHQRTSEGRDASPASIRDRIPACIQDYVDIFAKESFDKLPDPKPWDHAIELTPGAQPASCKVYPLAPKEQAELDAFLKENLATGRIRPSKSPMAAPVFFVKKKNGSLRLVQDYRALNALTVKNRYPLPLVPDLISQLKGARLYTKLDVRWGYNNVRIKEGDEWKAAFRTNRGLFEPLVMFFGLTNSPATFQTMMNDIFQDLIMEGVVSVYMDDILIFTQTLEEHHQVLCLVMAVLRRYKLYLHPDKCDFEQTRIEYLGLVISEGKVEMDPVKVAGVADWPAPTSKREVQSFLGFANFYWHFIEGFSHFARPLFDLTKKDSPWRWGGSEQAAFKTLKSKITSTPVLAFPDSDRPFRIEADSSDVATGAVLSQQSGEDDKWHPVAFYSKSLSEVERNYEIHDKEMLAIIRALEEWRHLLEGAQHPVEIWTDHKNLEYFRSAKKLNRRQARWSLYLPRFDFTLRHRPGRSMGKPDALSRRPDHGDASQDNQNLTLLRPEFFAIQALEGIQVSGEEAMILQDIRRGTDGRIYEDSVAKAVQALRRTSGRSLQTAEWAERDGLLLFCGKIFVPDYLDLRRRIMAQHHDSRVAGHAGRWKTRWKASRFWENTPSRPASGIRWCGNIRRARGCNGRRWATGW